MKVTSVILAAGKGTRMRSSTPKVLHSLSGLSMLEHVLIAQQKVADITCVVISEELQGHPKYLELLDKYKFQPVLQAEQKGTADALLAAVKSGITGDYIIMLYGDAPLVKHETLDRLTKKIADERELFMINLGFIADDPTGYGRMVLDDMGNLKDIIEEKEASPAIKKQQMCNSGIMVVKVEGLKELLDKISNNNVAGEFYATDLVRVANGEGLKCGYFVGDEVEILGVNDFVQLANADALLQKRFKNTLMLQGVRIVDPQSSYISCDLVVGDDVTICSNVYIAKGVVIKNGVSILSFSHIEGAVIGDGCVVGPFARLRPNTVLEENVKIGNFVETKNAHLAAKTKASHLSYIGDAKLGEGCNVGAGTIFCNYNGKKKSMSHIGKEVFIGSNSSIISPIEIGDNSSVAAGSVITKNIGERELAISRPEQVNLKKKT